MSYNGGRPFAKIQILDQEAREKKAQDKTGKMNAKEQEYRKLQVSLSIQGLAAAGRAELASEIMQVVAAKSGVNFIKSEEGVLKTGEWKMMKDFREEWIGKIEIQSDSIESVQKLFQTIHGGGIEVDGVCLVVEIESNFVKNGRGQAASPLA